MPLPKSIRIGPFIFSVKKRPAKGADIGQVLFNDCEIRISKTSTQIMRDTVLHECVHMLAFVSGHPDISDNESFVSSFSSLLLSMMRDNPKLVKYLTEGSK